MIDALEKTVTAVLRDLVETRVSTTTLLPSGALASAVVRPMSNGTFLVTDDGAARDDLNAIGCGDLTSGDRRRGTSIAERLGLIFDGSGFSVHEVTADQIAGAIVYVAEAAREWASSTAESAIKRQEASLIRRAETRVRALVPAGNLRREVELIGASTKKHVFDLVLDLSEERKIVFEAVAPNPNSLSSAHLKLFDLMGAHPSWAREAVTERLEDWSAADLTLLTGVATHVRSMDRKWRDLEELTH